MDLVTRWLQVSLCFLPSLAIHCPQTPSVDKEIQLDSRQLKDEKQRANFLPVVSLPQIDARKPRHEDKERIN